LTKKEQSTAPALTRAVKKNIIINRDMIIRQLESIYQGAIAQDDMMLALKAKEMQLKYIQPPRHGQLSTQVLESIKTLDENQMEEIIKILESESGGESQA